MTINTTKRTDMLAPGTDTEVVEPEDVSPPKKHDLHGDSETTQSDGGVMVNLPSDIDIQPMEER
jgi:hypothetical protein